MKCNDLNIRIFAVLALFLSNGSLASAQQKDIPIRVNRWISIQQLSGGVTYDRTAGSRPARTGDRLEAVGDGVTTSRKATATLQVDTGIGVINVLEQTKLRVRELSISPTDARITRLQVQQGQVRVKLRPFTNPNSTLEIETPAGLSGVRGTEFGLNVQNNGKTSVAVLSGGVATAAQGVEVQIPSGFQNFTIPGEPPSEPVPLRDDPSLNFQFDRILRSGIRQVRLVGQVDPVNLVTVDGQSQVVDRNGRFESVLYFVPSFLRINVVVTTPLGKTQAYELALQ